MIRTREPMWLLWLALGAGLGLLASTLLPAGL